MPEFRLAISSGASAARVRLLVRNALQAWNVNHRADEVLLVTTELVQNVTRHTAGEGELRLRLLPDAILVEVSDTDPLPPVLRTPDHHEPGGRGLLLVAAVSRRWGCRPRPAEDRPGKVVWAELVVS